MARITYVEGDATEPQGEGEKIIAHICNDAGSWGAGFVLAVGKRWPRAELAYRRLAANPKVGLRLGFVQFVSFNNDITVANMIAQHGFGDEHGPPIRYQAVEDCLISVMRHALVINASVHMPRIGCGLAGGEWAEIEPIIRRILIANDVDVVVYDFVPVARKENGHEKQ